MVFTQFINDYASKLRPLRGVIVFVVVMMIANWFWKLFVHDGDLDPNVTFLGLDITLPFRLIQKEVIRVVGLVFELFNIPFAMYHGNAIGFSNNQRFEVVWGCTGLKQAFIFACIMGTSRGPWRHKWWYILVGLAIVHVVNVLRVAIVGITLNLNPQSFELVHTYFFKYIFYLIIFLIWMIWEEYFFKKEMKKRFENSKPEHIPAD